LAISLAYTSGEEGDNFFDKMISTCLATRRERGEGSAPCERGSAFRTVSNYHNLAPYAGFRIRIHFFRIWIQRLRLETNPDSDPDPFRIQGFNDQKLEKNAEKKIYIFFLTKTAIHLSLGLHKVCPSYKRSLQLSKEAIQHFKT
jgi:hypothetical protein